jgi:hypothetical protein
MDKRADPPRPDRVDAMLERLETALARLDAAVAAAPARGEERRRVAELEAELSKLHGEQRALADTVDHVARKLDETIRRLRAAQADA